MHESNAEFVRSRTYPFCRQFLHEHELARSLLKSKTHLVGTFRANRKHLPKVVMHAKLKRGEIAAREYQKGVVVLKWKDVRDVRVLSTKHKPELEDPPSRRVRARTEVAEVRQEEEEDNEATEPGPSQARKSKRGGRQKKPITIHAYNKGKSRVDLFDQMVSCDTLLCKGIKWYRKLATELILGVGIVNAFIVFKEVTGKKIQVKKFREEICLGLLGIENDHEMPNAVCQRILKEDMNQAGKKIRRRCKGYYKKAYDTWGSTHTKKKGTKCVFTYCNHCEDKPYLCLDCFREKHE